MGGAAQPYQSRTGMFHIHHPSFVFMPEIMEYAIGECAHSSIPVSLVMVATHT